MRSRVIRGGEGKIGVRFMGEVTAPEKRGKKEEERILPPNCEAPLRGRVLGFYLQRGSRPRNPIHWRNFLRCVAKMSDDEGRAGEDGHPDVREKGDDNHDDH